MSDEQDLRQPYPTVAVPSITTDSTVAFEDDDVCSHGMDVTADCYRCELDARQSAAERDKRITMLEQQNAALVKERDELLKACEVLLMDHCGLGEACPNPTHANVRSAIALTKAGKPE